MAQSTASCKQRPRQPCLQNFQDEANFHQLLIHSLKYSIWERDETCLLRGNIIGMSATIRLSKYRPSIASLKPKKILIEGAAEVIEALVTTACLYALEHLMLVGDHHQPSLPGTSQSKPLLPAQALPPASRAPQWSVLLCSISQKSLFASHCGSLGNPRHKRMRCVCWAHFSSFVGRCLLLPHPASDPRRACSSSPTQVLSQSCQT